MKNYRVAILGCRSRGTAAGRAYHQHPRTEVVGVCDLLPERRDTLGEELGVPARYGDLDLMITETGPDIVVIPVGLLKVSFNHPVILKKPEEGYAVGSVDPRPHISPLWRKRS